MAIKRKITVVTKDKKGKRLAKQKVTFKSYLDNQEYDGFKNTTLYSDSSGNVLNEISVPLTIQNANQSVDPLILSGETGECDYTSVQLQRTVRNSNNIIMKVQEDVTWNDDIREGGIRKAITNETREEVMGTVTITSVTPPIVAVDAYMKLIAAGAAEEIVIPFSDHKLDLITFKSFFCVAYEGDPLNNGILEEYELSTVKFNDITQDITISYPGGIKQGLVGFSCPADGPGRELYYIANQASAGGVLGVNHALNKADRSLLVSVFQLVGVEYIKIEPKDIEEVDANNMNLYFDSDLSNLYIRVMSKAAQAPFVDSTNTGNQVVNNAAIEDISYLETGNLTDNVTQYQFKPERVFATILPPDNDYSDYNLKVSAEDISVATNYRYMISPLISGAVSYQYFTHTTTEDLTDVRVGDYLVKNVQTVDGAATLSSITEHEILGLFNTGDINTFILDSYADPTLTYNIVRYTNELLTPVSSSNNIITFDKLDQNLQSEIIIENADFEYHGGTPGIRILNQDYSWITNLEQVYLQLIHTNGSPYDYIIQGITYNLTDTYIELYPDPGADDFTQARIVPRNYDPLIKKYIYPDDLNIEVQAISSSLSSQKLSLNIEIQSEFVFNDSSFNLKNEKPQLLRRTNHKENLESEYTIRINSITNISNPYGIQILLDPHSSLDHIRIGDKLFQELEYYTITFIDPNDSKKIYVDVSGLTTGYAKLVFLASISGGTFSSETEVFIDNKKCKVYFGSRIECTIQDITTTTDYQYIRFTRSANLDIPLLLKEGSVVIQNNNSSSVLSISEFVKNGSNYYYSIQIKNVGFLTSVGSFDFYSSGEIFASIPENTVGEKDVIINNQQYGLITLKDAFTYYV